MMGIFVQTNRESARLPVGYMVAESGCWDWVGTHNQGYGQTWDPVKKTYVRAHRWMYEQVRGAVPDWLELDHLCRNRGCCNPDHLEAVPTRINILRGQGVAAHRARQTHCKNGHPLNGENLRVRLNGGRGCYTCQRAEPSRQRTYA